MNIWHISLYWSIWKWLTGGGLGKQVRHSPITIQSYSAVLHYFLQWLHLLSYMTAALKTSSHENPIFDLGNMSIMFHNSHREQNRHSTTCMRISVIQQQNKWPEDFYIETLRSQSWWFIGWGVNIFVVQLSYFFRRRISLFSSHSRYSESVISQINFKYQNRYPYQCILTLFKHNINKMKKQKPSAAPFHYSNNSGFLNRVWPFWLKRVTSF